MFQTDLLWQNDDRWASVLLGAGPHTIKEWGCLMTSLAMVVNGYGYNETPKSFNEKMKSGGGFQGEFVIPAMVPSLFPGVSYLGYDPCESSPAPISKIDAQLANGNPVIVQVDWSPNAGVQSHWVIAVKKEGSDYVILDPYKYSGDASGKKLLLLSRYKHQGNKLSEAITGAIYFTGTKSQKAGGSSGGTGTGAPATPEKRKKAAVPADSVDLYPTTDGLAMRNDPAISGALLKRLKDSDVLKSLESKADTAGKVGDYGQWLHIQDPSGEQGFVAAWYVSLESGGDDDSDAGSDAAAATTEAPATRTGELYVTPITDGLAMRSQPSLSGTLLKRLPLTSNLKVLEAASAAAPKIGVTYQWLKVSDVTGQTGYVAAWYVTEADAPALGVKAETDDDEGGKPDEVEQIIVRTKVANVAFRRMPFVANHSLIKRLPLRAELVMVDESEEKKIGVVNQWIKVKDSTGSQGYVAAWYVTK